MRGRVDRRTFGFSLHVPMPDTPNLLQKFDHGLGISRLFQLKERAPAPVLGSEVVPVVLADDLLISAYPPRTILHGGETQGPGAPGVSPRHHLIRCKGSDPASSDPNDRLVVFDMLISSAVVLDCFFLCGFPFSSFTTLVSTNMFHNEPADYPNGSPQSDYAHFVTGEDAAALPVTPPRFHVPANVPLLLEGPWILKAGQVCGIRTTGALAGGPSSVWFRAIEYPAKS